MTEEYKETPFSKEILYREDVFTLLYECYKQLKRVADALEKKERKANNT